jgi:hypothetical protein
MEDPDLNGGAETRRRSGDDEVSTFSEMDAEYLIRTRISRVAIIEW